MEYLIPFIYFLVVLIDAIINWYLIEKKNIKINHIAEGFYYSLASLILFIVIFGVTDIRASPLIIFPLITRLAFFDPLLLLFRKKPLSYEGGIKPEKEKSLYDRIEKLIGIDIIWLRLIYGLAYITYIIVYYGAFT